MNGIQVYTIEDLLKDIKDIGYPVIQLHSSSLIMKALPDYHCMHENSISFWVKASKHQFNQMVAELSKSALMQITIKTLYDFDVACKKCILIKNASSGKYEGNLFWPECLYGKLVK